MTLLQLQTNGKLNVEKDSDPRRTVQLTESNEVSALALCRQAPVIGHEETCREVVDLFKTNPDAPCIVYCQKSGRPEGLIMRDAFYRRMSGRFSRELFDSRPAISIADMKPMVVDISQPLSQLIFKALQRPESRFYDCVVLTEQNRYCGILTVKDLLRLSAVLQEEGEIKREFILDESNRHTQEIELSLSQVAEAAEATQVKSGRMKEWSQSGRTKLEQVSTSYTGVVNGMEERAVFVSELLQNADQISSITQKITELADHSSLLALNASIEAAHARQHGRGFQVVAEEVHSLARQTRSLSTDISHLLVHIQKLVAETAEAAAASLKEIRSCESIVAEGSRMFVQMEQAVEEVRNAGSLVYQLSEETADRVKGVRRELAEMSINLPYGPKHQSLNLVNR